MVFYTEDNRPVEINKGNFSYLAWDANLGLEHVVFKNGTEEWVKATEKEILKAVNDDSGMK